MLLYVGNIYLKIHTFVSASKVQTVVVGLQMKANRTLRGAFLIGNLIEEYFELHSTLF